ncbi:MAG TPA: AMP-binding protein [Acidimicrobiales bacterium]|nr:AMP-binding protein [Acidimicrobiales bacterium]
MAHDRIWDEARRELAGLPGGRGLNIAHEAVDRHAAGPRRDLVALRCHRRDGRVETLTYSELAEATDRFANVLAGLGVGPGDRVATLLGPGAEQHVALLGTLKARAVACPLFASFGPEPVRARAARAAARVLVTTPALHRRKVAPVRHRLPGLAHVLLAGGEPGATGAGRPDAGTLDLASLLAATPAAWTVPATDPDDEALVHFTSGTTGTPKGAVHVHEAVVAHHATAARALGLGPDDVFWCTADPGWVTGTSYGVVAPLTHGATNVVVEGPADPARWCRTLASAGVTVWYTSPTALRLLARAGDDLPRGHDLARLRLVASVGEPLDADLAAWARRALGAPVVDTWWQTETGGIMVATPLDGTAPAGSLGRPLPGVEAAVLALGDGGRADVRDGRVRPVESPGAEGELALRAGWPSMFRAYLGDEARYAACFAGGWYLTGDLVRRDAAGWLWFVGRADDVINTAGHLVGPVEVEGVLHRHPAVAEAAAFGVPDPVAGEAVAAAVVPVPGAEPGDALRAELLAHARRHLGPGVAPRSVDFVTELPRTESGKIVRRALRRAAGAPSPPPTTGGAAMTADRRDRPAAGGDAR